MSLSAPGDVELELDITGTVVCAHLVGRTVTLVLDDIVGVERDRQTNRLTAVLGGRHVSTITVAGTPTGTHVGDQLHAQFEQWHREGAYVRLVWSSGCLPVVTDHRGRSLKFG